MLLSCCCKWQLVLNMDVPYKRTIANTPKYLIGAEARPVFAFSKKLLSHHRNIKTKKSCMTLFWLFHFLRMCSIFPEFRAYLKHPF